MWKACLQDSLLLTNPKTFHSLLPSGSSYDSGEMLHPRVPTLDAGKDPPPPPAARSAQPRAFPFKLLKLISLFLASGVCLSVISIQLTRRFSGAWDPSGFDPCGNSDPIGIERWSRPPHSLIHRMTDEELFWRASMVPQVKDYPFPRVPKVSFMFLTRGPLPLAPLWERFFKGNAGHYSIYIHALPSYQADFTPDSVFYRRQIPSKIAEWGEMSMCDAERRLLANALLDISNERFVLLSESCIPLHNFSVVYQYLLGSGHSFTAIIDDPGPYGRGRYNSRMAPEVSITQWRKGSQWFEVNRKLAISIVKDLTFYPKFKQFCRPHCYVDEHYFPTLLSIEYPHLLANRSVTLVDWSRGGAHPATFGRGDISESFMKKMLEDYTCTYNGQDSSICHLFARKFAPSTLEPLLQSASKWLGIS